MLFYERYRLYLAAAGIAFLVCVGVTPIVRRLAERLGMIDRPDRHRKLHGRAVPLGGGAAVLLAFLGSTATVFVLSRSQQAVLAKDTHFFLALLAAALVICLVGLADDRYRLRGRQKLAGQIVASLVLVGSGLVIWDVELFGMRWELGVLAVPFTIFWILGAINALNLIDGADGLATSVGLVLCLAIAGIAIITGHRTEAFLACAMAGSLAGFLVYNSPPANIFLGDAGSMLIGLVIGTLALRGSFKGPATAALAAPTAILAIPILDTGMAILRRKLTGRSLYTTDRGHLHHVLQQRGLTGRLTVAIIGTLCAITAVAGVVSVYLKSELIAVSVAAAVCGTLVVFRVFGHQECLLLVRRGKNMLVSLLPYPGKPAGPAAVEMETQFQGNRQWNDLWRTLTEFAERFDLTMVQLSITVPAKFQDYHASWCRNGHPDQAEAWSSEIPLMAGDVTVGRLKITGTCTNGSVCTWIGDLIGGLKPFEAQMLELLEELEEQGGGARGKTGRHAGVEAEGDGSQASESPADARAMMEPTAATDPQHPAA